MASFSHSFLLCILLIASSFQIHARESKFFRGVTPYERQTYQPEAAQVEEKENEFVTPFSDFNDTTQLPRFKETPSNLNGHVLYGQEPQWFPTEQRKQPQVEGKEFVPFNSDFNDTTQLPVFKETSSPSQNQNGTLYGQEHQQFPTSSNITTNTTTKTTTDLEKEPTTVDYSPFNRESTNRYEEENFESKDLDSGFSGYGMGDTRSMENGKYFYDLKNEYGRSGFPSGRGTGGAGYEHRYRGVSPSEDQKKYRSYGGRYGNEIAYYETDNYYSQGNQEEQMIFFLEISSDLLFSFYT